MNTEIQLIKQEFYKHLKTQQEQIAKLLNLIKKLTQPLPQYNEAINVLNNKIDQIRVSQLILYTLYLQSDEEKKLHLSTQIEKMLNTADFSKNKYLEGVLRDFLLILKQPDKDEEDKPETVARPAWFQGIIDGGKTYNSRESMDNNH
jgi:hypothetical protein